jgi:hypothetical protein
VNKLARRRRLGAPISDAGFMLTKILAPFAVLLILVTIFSLFVMLLWNWLMPVIFGLPQITLLQAWGLTALSSFLFKNSTTTSF